VSAAVQQADSVRRFTPNDEAILSRASNENFTVASMLLGRRLQAHLRAIYGFARLTDQIGDDAPGDRLALLDALERDLGRAFTGMPDNPLLRRLSTTIHTLGLPRAPFQRLIDANRRDQRVTRYPSYAALVEYCELSANPVGELVLHVFRAATPERIRLSDRVCTALQLIEHAQDVGEDYRRGRIYLPADDLARFGVMPPDLGAGHASRQLRSLLEFEVDRARQLLDEGASLIGLLSGRARLAVAGYVGGGRATIDALAASGFDVLAQTPRAGRIRRAARVLEAFSWRR
jgi:squalene synthase HpnC